MSNLAERIDAALRAVPCKVEGCGLTFDEHNPGRIYASAVHCLFRPDVPAQTAAVLVVVEELASALRDVSTFTGHEHWDADGTRGTNCSIRVRYRGWREKHNGAIDPARRPETP